MRVALISVFALLIFGIASPATAMTASDTSGYVLCESLREGIRAIPFSSGDEIDDAVRECLSRIDGKILEVVVY